MAESPGALVSCTFHIGKDVVQVHTVGTRTPLAIAPLAPVIQMPSGSSVDELVGYPRKAGDAEAGTAVVTDSGNVAAVRLRLDGEGDAFLLVALGEAGAASPDRRQRVDVLAEAVSGHLR